VIEKNVSGTKKNNIVITSLKKITIAITALQVMR